jgi:endo-1,4-beta-xylanase
VKKIKKIMIALMLLSLSLASCSLPGLDPAAQGIGTPSTSTRALLQTSLRAMAEKQGREFYVGTCMPNNFQTIDGGRYSQMAYEQFNMVTAENCMKMDTVGRGSLGSYNFGPGDTLVSFAQQNNMKVHGHALIWYSQRGNNSWTNNPTLAQMKQYISDVVTHWKGKVHVWDVVNEHFEVSGGNPRSTSENPWNKINDYVAEAFKAARAADPAAKLIINDFNLCNTESKFNAMYNLVRDLKNRGIPIDGVGFQMHLRLNELSAAQSFASKIQRLADLGVESYVTEMDVRLPPSTSSASGFQTQAEIYKTIMDACVNQRYCKAFQVWGISDKYSWCMSTFNEDRPLLFDDNYNPKPAYNQVLAALVTTGIGGVDIRTSTPSGFPEKLVALKARYNNLYLCAQLDVNADAPLYANRSAVGLWEKYYMVDLGGGQVAFRSAATGKYVCAEDAGASQAVANRISIDRWETFDLKNLSGITNGITLKNHATEGSYQGWYLRFDGLMQQYQGTGCIFYLEKL